MSARHAAQVYIDGGFRPIPVWNPRAGCKCEKHGALAPDQCHGKVPKDPNWKDRTYFAANEFADDDNVALAMGQQPDGRWLVALDADGEFPFERFLGPLPMTLTTRSGRGEHRIFQVEPRAALGNFVDVFATRSKVSGYRPGLAGALDLRYARGAVVAPPSLHRSGVRYESNDEPIAQLPWQAMRRILSERERRGLKNELRWERGGKRA